MISRISWLVKVITDAIFIIQQSQQVTCEKCFFFFSILIDQGKRVRIFYFLFFFHLDPHFYFSKMEKMKIKIWREGESIIVHLITFFLFLLHFIFLSTIKKKKNTRFQLIIIYEYTIIYGDGLLSMPLRPWPKAPISKNLHFYF